MLRGRESKVLIGAGRNTSGFADLRGSHIALRFR
jgi:hypothetical protein